MVQPLDFISIQVTQEAYAFRKDPPLLNVGFLKIALAKVQSRASLSMLMLTHYILSIQMIELSIERGMYDHSKLSILQDQLDNPSFSKGLGIIFPRGLESFNCIEDFIQPLRVGHTTHHPLWSLSSLRLGLAHLDPLLFEYPSRLYQQASYYHQLIDALSSFEIWLN